MKNIMWGTCLILFCFIASIFGTNYTYYVGVAYNINNGTSTNQTMTNCICQCLLATGCTALTFYNGTQTCFLVYDSSISDSEVTLNSSALLLIVNASVN